MRKIKIRDFIIFFIGWIRKVINKVKNLNYKKITEILVVIGLWLIPILNLVIFFDLFFFLEDGYEKYYTIPEETNFTDENYKKDYEKHFLYFIIIWWIIIFEIWYLLMK